MKEIPLTKGKVAIVDDDDFEHLNQYKWHCSNKGYACRTFHRKSNLGGGELKIMMHREIMNPPEGVFIDHINHDTLDNRKENLRIVSRSFNNLHALKRKANTSGFTGVVKRGKRWLAQTKCNKKQIHLGLYETPEEASKVYQDYVRKLWEEAGHEYIPIVESGK